MVCILSIAFVAPVHAQNGETPKIIVSASGGLAFPVGRFGETDPDADPPKTGHDNGYDFGGEIGLLLNPSLSVGIAADYSRFDIDFEGIPVNPNDEGRTTTLSGHIWARYMLHGGFEHWQPYALLGFGAGRPTGTVDYADPVPFLVNDSTVMAAKLESVVKTSFSFIAAIGVLIPFTEQVGVSIEPRYHSVSTKGAGRTDKITTTSGDVIETDVGTDGGGTVRLKAKSNTDWWEIRGGVIIRI